MNSESKFWSVFFVCCALVFISLAGSCAYLGGKCADARGDWDGNSMSCTMPKVSK